MTGAVRPSRRPVLPTALFGVYLVLLVWAVLWKLQLPWIGEGTLRTVKLVPFVAGVDTGPSAPPEVAANLLLFVPFGLYLGLLAPAWSLWTAAGVVAGTSLALEVAQYVLAVGSSDITDLIVNTAGGLAGIGLLALASRGLRAKTAAVMTRVCSVATVFAVVAVGMFVASPVRYGPQDDVLCTRVDGSATTPSESEPTCITGRRR